MVRLMIRYLLYVVIASLLVGCGASSRSSKPEGGLYLLEHLPAGQVPMQYTENIIALDEDARDSLLYISHRQGRIPSGQVKITYALQNSSDRESAWITWKVVFYDSRNFKIEETEWQKTYFPPLQIQEISVNSIRKDVENFTLLLKSAE